MSELTAKDEGQGTVIFTAPCQEDKTFIFRIDDTSAEILRLSRGEKILQKYVWVHNILTWMQSVAKINPKETVHVELMDKNSGEVRSISFCEALDIIRNASQRERFHKDLPPAPDTNTQ